MSVIPARGEYGRKAYREQRTPAGGQGKKSNITYRNPPRGCGSFLFDTICPYSLYTAKARQIFLFVCTHRTVGAFFVCRKMAASAQRPVCPVAPLPRPTAPKFGSHPNFRRRSKSPCTLIERTMVQGSGACEKSVGSHRSNWQRR